MADPRDNRGRFVKKELADERELNAAYDKTIAQLKEINIQKARGAKIDEQQKQHLVNTLQNLKKEVKLREEAESLLKNQIDAADEILGFSAKMRKNYEDMKKNNSDIAGGFATMNNMAGALGFALKKAQFSTKGGAEAAKDAAVAMADYEGTVSRAIKEFKRGNISAESLADTIKSADETMEDFVDSLDDSNAEIAKIKQGLVSAVDSAKDLSKAFAESKKEMSQIKDGFGDLAQGATSSIPGLNGMATAFSNLGSLGVIGGIIALGSAFHQLLQWYREGNNIKDPIFGLDQVSIDMAYDLGVGIAGLNKELAQTSLQLGQQIQLSGAAKANMIKLGVSGQEFADATKYSSNNLGLMGKNAQEAGADMAMYAKRTGTSAEQLGSIANTFRIVGNLSGKAAVNTLGMAESVAKAAGVPINALFEDLAESSELFLQNNYGNEKSMIRQVATLRVMGVAAQKVLQAGQNMVLNYKDSIKAEMRLSALLGKQVDLSRVRQKFASGDAAGAAQLLRTQLKGVDMDKMNMFQRQALQEATGMDMDTIMKLGKGGKGGALQTDQEKMVGSIQQLGNTFDNVMKKYIGDGITIKALSDDAARKYWTAEAANQAALKKLQMQKDIDETKKKIGELLITAGLILTAIGVAGAFGRGPAKFLQKPLQQMGKPLRQMGNFFKNIFTKKATTTVAQQTLANTTKKYTQKQILAGFAGREAREQALKQAAKSTVSSTAKTGLNTAASLTDDVAKVTLQNTGKFGLKSIMSGLGKGLVKGGVWGLLGTAASMAGDYFGGQREQEGLAEGDRSKVNQGKILQAGATALEYGGYGAGIGAVIGSVVPVLGTSIGGAVGGAIGGVVGGIKGIWDGWFSEDAKQKEEQLKQMEIQKEEQSKAIEIQEQLQSQSEALGAAAQDTGFWQSAMIAQLIEATRLLDIIAFASDDEDDATREIYLDGKKITRLNYDRASTLYNVLATANPTAK